jgi:hemerythrin-like domain-containing protein
MKRSTELTPLSHDHHQALFVAMQLKRAAPDDVARAVKAFLDFTEETGDLHFRIEEEILLPGWVAAGTCDRRTAAAMAARVAAEHLEIRASTRLLQAGDVSADRARELGSLLERHVRFEERELFPLVEGSLGEKALRSLGAEIAAAES